MYMYITAINPSKRFHINSANYEDMDIGMDSVDQYDGTYFLIVGPFGD